ncbi:MAG: CAP domain-containing protein [Planctomycetota bacterium]
MSFKRQKRSRLRLRKNGASNSTLNFERLERRELLAGVYLNSSNGELTIFGDSNGNVASATEVGSLIRTDLAGSVRDFNLSDVNSILFIGFGGNDHYTNNTSLPAAMYGQAGNDTLIGGSAADNIVGGVGDDTLRGNAGDDRIVGAAGNDTMFGDAGNDRMFGSADLNEIYGGADDDVIYGGDAIDTIFGEGGIDQIYALAGNDIINSGTGGVAGSSGIAQGDLVLGLGGNDQITGGGGLDIFWGGEGDDTLIGGNGENRLHGQNGDDTITGGLSADFLRGQNDNDTINGGGGNDTILGGAGNDTLNGDGGADNINGEAGTDTANGGAGNDTIELGIGTDDVAVFSTSYDNATVAGSQNGQLVTVSSSASGTDTVRTTELLTFSDRQISSDQATLSEYEAASYSVLNSYRQAQSRTTFSTPSDLAAYARNWASEMVSRGLVHSSNSSQLGLLTNGRTTVGENIVRISDEGQTADEVAAEYHNLWVNSTVHRNNMRNSAFSEVGVGIVQGGGFWYGIHIFVG